MLQLSIDIDPQAVDLGRRIVNVLAPNEDITITDQKVSELKDIKDVTHIIFSSTIPLKYSILEELYDLTNENVNLAMRFVMASKQYLIIRHKKQRKISGNV